MSMLAEPRRKQKIINLRAKNNAWSNDTTKFGQRMLEKMGWSTGKGLGANENGIVEHVVARYKNDEKGLGFEDKNDQWTKHEDDFNSLLANLSNSECDNITLPSGISLETKSKTSKARIHYHKFTRGKDLTRYSEKDLANIFGKKSFKETEIKECHKEDTLKTTEHVFTDKGNMDEYFKNKLASLKTKLLGIDTDSKDNEESDYAFQGFSNSNGCDSNQNEHGDQTFSFYKNNVSLNLDITDPDVEIQRKKKKKLKQKNMLNHPKEMDENNLAASTQEKDQEISVNNQPTREKKSKKVKHLNCILGTQPVDEVKESKRSTECMQNAGLEIEMDGTSTKVKKSTKKKYKDCIQENLLSDKALEATGAGFPQEDCHDDNVSKKKSKEKKVKEYDEDEIKSWGEDSKLKKNERNHVEHIQDHIISVNDNVPKKKKKRKYRDLL